MKRKNSEEKNKKITKGAQDTSSLEEIQKNAKKSGAVGNVSSTDMNMDSHERSVKSKDQDWQQHSGKEKKMINRREGGFPKNLGTKD